jgi:flagellar biosynthesis/type III secretory pathway protein FliH
MIAMDNYSSSYAKALVAATPQDQLIETEKPKSFKGISAEQIAQMETEMAKLQREIKLIESSYGPDHLNLVLARGYLVTLVQNTEVTKYLAQNHGAILTEFKRLTEVFSMALEEKA